MASGVFWIILFSVIWLSLASNLNERVCTKMVLNKFYIHRFDQYVKRVVSVEKTRKSIIFICCEGYREKGRRKELPTCEPICKQPCGYGYCYRPNLCACYYGYEFSELNGNCQRIGRYVTKTASPTLSTRSGIDSPTWKIENETSSTVADFNHNKLIPNKNSGLETTTIPTTKQPKSFEIAYPKEWVNFRGYRSSTIKNPVSANRINFEVESSTREIGLKPSLRTVEDFPRVKFITYSNTTTSSTRHKSVHVESSTKPNDIKPSSAAFDDFPRVKFIKHASDSSLETVNSFESGETNSEVVSSTSRIRVKPSVLKSGKDIELLTDMISRSPANCTMGVCICQMGYELFEGRLCHECRIGSQCQCRDGYAFDSFRCKPLCNGVFDGCIGGTCIDYNECSCNNGSDKFSDDIFRCYAKAANILDQNRIFPKWYLLLLLVPAVIAVVSFCIVIKRSRSSKSNRLKAQRHIFQEIRYFHTNNNPLVEENHRGADEKMFNQAGCGRNAIQHDGSIVIVTV